MERAKKTKGILDVRVVFDHNASNKIYEDMKKNRRKANQQIQFIVDHFYKLQPKE